MYKEISDCGGHRQQREQQEHMLAHIGIRNSVEGVNQLLLHSRTQLTDVTQSCRFGDKGQHRAIVHTLHCKAEYDPLGGPVASATTQATPK